MELSILSAHIINIAFSLLLLFIMYLFRLYKNSNISQVLFSFIVGFIGSLLYTILRLAALTNLSLSYNWYYFLFDPIAQQILTAAVIIIAFTRKRFKETIDLGVYGWALGLGFATAVNYSLINYYSASTVPLYEMIVYLFMYGPFYSTTSAVVGLVLALFFITSHGTKRILTLVGGLAAIYIYIALFSWLITLSFAQVGYTLGVVYAISGLTLLSLFITGQLQEIMAQLGLHKKRANDLLDIVIPIGIKLSSEKDLQKLLETMLAEARTFCNADGGTIYLKRDKFLEFAVIQNNTLKVASSGIKDEKLNLPTIPLFDDAGAPNAKHIAAYSAWKGVPINIEDIYRSNEFDFSGTIEFDKRMGYKTRSILTIPLKNADNEVQGVIQLINALNPETKTTVRFDADIQQLMESFSSLAGAALERYDQEQRLRSKIQQLQIEIDEVKRNQQVAEITDSEYFKELKTKVTSLKKRDDKGKSSS